ncbi:MAG: ATP phosphoribosyltransferase [bacterium]|nr:ATP phosphoribosyltransferase [bacterium]
MKKIKFGLPKGSLNTVARGNTCQIIKNAGYDIKGYEPGKESDSTLRILNDPEIAPLLARPQSAPVELSRNLLDLAIVGDDWVCEESVNMTGDKIIRVGDLEYGQTRLVICTHNHSAYKSISDFFEDNKYRTTPVLCFTEYPNITRHFFMKDKVYRKIYGNKKPLIQVRGLVDGENNMVQIINSDGVTEGYMAKGADLIVDNTQTGSTLRKYGLRELETIMKSSAGLYAGPGCKGWKEDKAKEIYKMLYGAIAGQYYFDLKFNVNNESLESVKKYLVDENLCSNEPTISSGDEYAAINILIQKDKFPDTLRVLRQKYKASAVVRSEVKQFIA